MRKAVVGILFATALWTSLPRMMRASVEAIRLLPLSYEQRRERVIGSFYSSIQRIRAELREDEAVGISMRDPQRDAGGAVFANYYLYPQRTKFYASLDDYRRTVLDDPAQAKRLVRVDASRTAEARLMTYLGIREEEVAAAPVVRDPKPSAEAHRELILPIAIAIDGHPGNAYLTEGVLVSDVDTAVTLTFFPGGESKTFALRAKEPLILRDVVYTITSRLDAGWLRLTAPVPVRAGFWLLIAWRREWRPLLIAGAAIVPMLGIYLVMYLASDWVTVDLVNATAPRLLLHFIGPALYLLGYANQQNDRRNA